MKLCTEGSSPSFILCRTRVVAIVQGVAKGTYCQVFVSILVASRSRECLISFLPCHVFDDCRSTICDVTSQCHRRPFNWSLRMTYSGAEGIWNINCIIRQTLYHVKNKLSPTFIDKQTFYYCIFPLNHQGPLASCYVHLFPQQLASEDLKTWRELYLQLPYSFNLFLVLVFYF